MPAPADTELDTIRCLDGSQPHTHTHPLHLPCRYEDDALPAVDWVLDVARAAVYRYGIRGLVIDVRGRCSPARVAALLLR